MLAFNPNIYFYLSIIGFIMQLAAFSLGQVVGHLKYGYRGVIVDVDPVFQGSDQWYAKTAVSQPAKDRPWYHVLVDEHEYETYVAEEHLFADASDSPVIHPELDDFLLAKQDGRYTTRHVIN